MALISWRKLQAGLSGKGKPTEAARAVVQAAAQTITSIIWRNPTVVPDASLYTKGKVLMATGVEIDTAYGGVNSALAINPQGLADSIYANDASTTVKGRASFNSDDFTVAAGAVSIVAASDTVSGQVELATAAETNTGTDTARAVTPDGLAGSNLGTLIIGVIAVNALVSITVGDGKVYIPVPAALNGMNLIRAQAIVITAGTTNATTIDIYNVTDSQDMLSTAISIASGATVGTVGVINATYDDVATNDVLRVDVTTVSTTAPKGLLVALEFRLP